MELIKDNYLFGTGSGKEWDVSIAPATRQTKTYFEETLDTAEYVYANKTGPLVLLFSGGLDSQYVLNIFKGLKFNFTTVIIRLRSHSGEIYNEHDIKYAIDYCEGNSISPIYFDLNFDQFVHSGKILEIAESVNCASYVLPATMHVASQIDGFTVLGNDPPYLRLNKETNTWQLEELEIIHSLLRFYKKHELPGCPYFLSYTPEMMLSFLLDDSMASLANDKYPGKIGSNSTKSHVFNRGSGFNMPCYDFEKGSFVKLTGYEIINNSNIANHPHMLKFAELRKICGGEYLEDYTLAINRLQFRD
jgi:hypothetical protein